MVVIAVQMIMVVALFGIVLWLRALARRLTEQGPEWRSEELAQAIADATDALEEAAHATRTDLASHAEELKTRLQDAEDLLERLGSIDVGNVPTSNPASPVSRSADHSGSRDVPGRQREAPPERARAAPQPVEIEQEHHNSADLAPAAASAGRPKAPASRREMVAALHAQGLRPHQIAAELGAAQAEVELALDWSSAAHN